MKYTKTHTKTIPNNRWEGASFLWIATLLFVISACSDNAVLTEQQPEQEISQIDGQPIVNIEEADFYGNERLEQFRENLAANHGRAIIRAVNEQVSLSAIQQSPMIAVKDLASYTSAKETNVSGDVPDIGSTHLRIIEPSGEVNDYVLTLRPYYKDPPKDAGGKASGSKQLSASNTYLVYSPDRFYLQDDADGNEQWPVTIPAVSLNDPDDTITVTFNEDGLVSTSLDQNKGNSQSSEPQLVMMEGTTVLNPNPCVEGSDCDPGGGGPGGGGPGGGGDPDNDNPGCTEHAIRGNTGGATAGIQTYFTVNTIRLWATGDGDGAAELQMFIRNDDDYAGECLNREYKYRFDEIRDAWGAVDRVVVGADGDDYYIEDINHEDITYNAAFNLGPGFARPFPLFDLTNRPGPWRFVLSDDDKDYKDFTHRREHEWGENIQTYDMSTGTWSEVFTGFSTHSIQYGSSDDPNRESGVRRITVENVLDRSSNGIITATRNYSGGRFTYEFSLQGY